jgi:hypothetical protein
LGKREGDDDAGSAGFAIRGGDGSAVGAGNGIDEGQTEAVAVRIAAFDAALEEVPQDFWVESMAVVFENQQSSVFGGLHVNGEGAVGRQML